MADATYEEFAAIADPRNHPLGEIERRAAEYVREWLTEHGLAQIRVDDENENPSYAILDTPDGDHDEQLDHAVAWLPGSVITNPTEPAWNPVVTLTSLTGYLGPR